MTAPPSANVGRDWDAGAYDRVADPQEDWGREVSIDSHEGDEVLLDAGCGSGRVTELLLERLPHGCVIGVDASEAMVERARARLGRRAEVRTGDLAELELEASVDAVFSNAVFHWLPDHERLFERLYAALRPGGRLAAQCGAGTSPRSARRCELRTTGRPSPESSARPPGPGNPTSPSSRRPGRW